MLVYTTPIRYRCKIDFKQLNGSDGNVLFIILLCVALFAGLAYAVTQSTRSSGVDTSAEQINLEIAQASQYFTTIEMAIQRMKISNGCTDEQISFETPMSEGYTNLNVPVSNICHVFRP